ncbi:hypothetical protein M758_8G173300 [Ceratodon purpureus]|uniref:Uncharacterized protein n=1 Tax=Ceratodon purpureus TaxID=3225 RepID=A0A8T0H1R4_CERPU|nr:hypothetical protein KC19_8G178500 [Ceratodon purpureus]KAG0609290.1 hypothetical protein M758_8G173300 [Ceratodon purpureus]
MLLVRFCTLLPCFLGSLDHQVRLRRLRPQVTGNISTLQNVGRHIEEFKRQSATGSKDFS